MTRKRSTSTVDLFFCNVVTTSQPSAVWPSSYDGIVNNLFFYTFSTPSSPTHAENSWNSLTAFAYHRALRCTGYPGTPRPFFSPHS